MSDVLQRTSFIVVLAVLALVLSPVCAWLSKWMFRQAFGKQVDRLAALIAQLEHGT